MRQGRKRSCLFLRFMQYYYESETGDGLENLARDEYLLSAIQPGEIIMYLYVNTGAVIIGRNQNPYIECNLKRMEEDGVQLVRRVSGGGAVYHDSGNLNFSFIAGADIYDEKRQTRVIVNALESFGVKCEVSGRNDITADGRKFSGNAFCGRGEKRLHHGTLLINSDLGVFDRYLVPSRQKLEAKGVKSVRARVCNLSEFNPDITPESMAAALRTAFEAEYGRAEDYSCFDEAAVRALREKHESFGWRMGETPHFDCEMERRFPWGMARLCFGVEGGAVKRVKLYTDSLDTGLSEMAESLLAGKSFERDALASALYGGGSALSDIAEMIKTELD